MEWFKPQERVFGACVRPQETRNMVSHHALLSKYIFLATLPIKGPQLLIHSPQRPGLSEAKERAQDGTTWLG